LLASWGDGQLTRASVLPHCSHFRMYGMAMSSGSVLEQADGSDRGGTFDSAEPRSTLQPPDTARSVPLRPNVAP